MHVVVTGAAGALGRQVAAVLASAGHTVSGIDLVNGIDNVADLSQKFSGVDLGVPAQVNHAIEEAANTGGAIGGLINIAGGFAWETVADGDPATWDRMFEINVRSTLNTCRAVLPHLAEKASIVNIGAAAAARAGAGMGAYTASKAGVARLTESMAEELKDRHVRVNAVLPSIIDTPANRKDMPDADFSSWVSATEIANVITFLISPAASGVTGALIPVTGRV